MFIQEALDQIKTRLASEVTRQGVGNTIISAVDVPIGYYGRQYINLAYNGDLYNQAWGGGGMIRAWELVVAIHVIEHVDRVYASSRFVEDLIEIGEEVTLQLNLWYQLQDLGTAGTGDDQGTVAQPIKFLGQSAPEISELGARREYKLVQSYEIVNKLVDFANFNAP